jgi:hypothetical protein
MKQILGELTDEADFRGAYIISGRYRVDDNEL